MMAPADAVSEQRLLETFLELVRIDSPSGLEADVAEYCRVALTDLGFTVTFDDTTPVTGSNIGNLLAHRPGMVPGRGLVLSAHMDCVQPCIGVEPVIEAGVIFSVGETVLGGDDKAGIAVILEALRRLSERRVPTADVQVILTVSEEVGLQGAKALSPDAVTGDVCLVLDAEGEPGGVVVGAPTHYTFEAVFHGQAAHAGVAPEQGKSAITMAARAVAGMSLGRLDDETTANIGTFNGGSATNVVANSARLTGECRSLDRVRVERVKSAMDGAMRHAAQESGGRVDIEWTKEYEGFRFAEDDPLLGIVESSMRAVGIKPRRFSTGGGSDGSIFFADGVSTLVLSSGLRDVHSIDESVSLADMESLTRLLCDVAERLAD